MAFLQSADRRRTHEKCKCFSVLWKYFSRRRLYTEDVRIKPFLPIKIKNRSVLLMSKEIIGVIPPIITPID